MVRSFSGQRPEIHPTAWVDDSAQLIGAVTLGAQASVWCGAVLRADINSITVGARTNVQDVSVLHVTEDDPVVLLPDVTLGHRVVIHGATIRSFCLIGIGAIVLDGAEIGEECLVAAGSVVTPGTRVPPRSLVRGVPGQVIRTLTAKELEFIRVPTRNYLEYIERYRAESPS